jgi:sugar (pentulose or hexulose) kinase
MDALVVGIDSGTQSSRACVYSTDGQLVSSGSSANEILYNAEDESWGEQDSASWWASTSQVRGCAVHARNLRHLANTLSHGGAWRTFPRRRCARRPKA